jgi:PleD family two-component response regulator
VSVSIGIGTVVAGAEAASEGLISQADRALYEAKRQGRARVCHFSAL